MTKDIDDVEKSPGEGLRENGIYVFMDEVNHETIKPIIEWILYENYVSTHRKKELLLMICSSGGDLAAAYALIDTMRTSQIPIKTVGLGMIASCGLLIFISGTPGRRILTPNTSILSHQYAWANEGKHHELFATMREYTLTQQRMLNLYRETTGLDDDTIKAKLLPPQDVWLDSDEALALNICDDVSIVMPTLPKPRRKSATSKTLDK
jgi:ATP-dependent Clp protease protease subunit